MLEDVIAQKKMDRLFFHELEKQTLHATQALLVFEKGDLSALQQVKLSVHAIKGAARIVRAKAIEALCHSLEDLMQEVDRLDSHTSAVELLIRGVDLLATFSHTGNSTISGELQAAITSLQEHITACIAKKAYQLPPTEIDLFANRLQIRDTFLSIEVAQARELLGMSYEISKQAKELEKLEGNAYVLALKNHMVCCNHLCNRLQTLQMIPFSTVSAHLERFVRELCVASKKDVRLVVLQSENLVDKEVLDAIKLPLLQLIKNAIDHGIEDTHARAASGKSHQGLIVIEVVHHEDRLLLSVTDDGAGIDYELLRKKIGRDVGDVDLLFVEKISAKKEISYMSGRGVGLKSVRDAVAAIGGAIDIDTVKGVGTSIELNIPNTLSLLSVVLVDIGGELYGCMSAKLENVAMIPEKECIHNQGAIYFKGSTGQLIRIVDTRALLGYGSRSGDNAVRHICIIKKQDELIALEVDRVLGTEGVMVQSNWSLLGNRRYIMGCALARATSPVLLLRVEELY